MPKYRQVKVNLRPEDYDRLEREAIASEISMAELFRQSVGVGIPDRRDRNQDEIRLAMLYELKRIGTNINQIARYVNANKAIDRAALDALVGIEEELKRFRP
ncbi:hypothetical protein HCR_23410 (plasmid) [Hydrogenimonas cancrithermarum]|uniref:Bacterial mobilisation domain-containing protein n=2 Tax=Hydrogenimonas cancrithermarum TaxID=2993563 RepID=A0ABN6WXV9_9BACT|nr:hypothetical protein HCR_23410 [Hydrogenimonas cancrithermarum]